MLVIWKDRARPLRARCGARSAVTSSPANVMRPLSGRKSPASWPMKVVLPAPFGPMTACVSPSRTSKSMPSVARRAPKVFTSWRASSIGLVENPGESAAKEDDREYEQRSEDHLPVLRPPREEVFDEEQRERAKHGP